MAHQACLFAHIPETAPPAATRRRRRAEGLGVAPILYSVRARSRRRGPVKPRPSGEVDSPGWAGRGGCGWRPSASNVPDADDDRRSKNYLRPEPLDPGATG